MQKLISKLISFQSDKDHPQETKKCFDFVVKYLRKNGLKVKTYLSEGKPSLVAGWKLKKHYQYILNGHLDVVPADYDKAFEPYVKKGRLYGRGASDMKGVDAVMIKLISSKELKEVDAALMLTTDEEIGGFNGVKYLLEEKGYSCDCAVIPDGGDNFQLTLAEKGVVHIKLNARGKSAHGSRPWLGENAIEKLIRIYQEIKNKMPETTPDNRWQPTVNLGRLTGGKAANVIPSQAEMLLDFRYPQNRQRKRIISLVKKACQKNKEVSYQVLVAGGALVNRKNNKYIQNVLKTAANHNIKLKYHRSHGASDGRFFSAKNIPVIIFKPVCSEPHIKDEWVDLKSLEKFSQILKDFLLTP